MVFISKIKLTVALTSIFFVIMSKCQYARSATLPTMASIAGHQSRYTIHGSAVETPYFRYENSGSIQVDDHDPNLHSGNFGAIQVEDPDPNLLSGDNDGLERKSSIGSSMMFVGISADEETRWLATTDINDDSRTETGNVHDGGTYFFYGEQSPNSNRKEESQKYSRNTAKEVQSTGINAPDDKLNVIQFPGSNQPSNTHNLHSYLPPTATADSNSTTSSHPKSKTMNSINLESNSTASWSSGMNLDPTGIIVSSFVNPPPRCSGHCEVADSTGACRPDIECILG